MAEPGNKRRPRQKRWLVLGAIVVLALIFLIPFIQEGGARVDTSVEVETQAAVLGEIEQTVSGYGLVEEAAATPVTVSYGGTLRTVSVQEGDLVQEGDVLAAYDEASLREQISDRMDRIDEIDAALAETDGDVSFSVTAPADGMIREIYAVRGDRIDDVMEASGGLILLSADGLLRVELQVPAEDSLEPGDAVTVTAGDRQATATVDALEMEDGQETLTALLLLEDDGTFSLGETVELRDGAGELLGTGTTACNSPVLVTAQSGLVSQVEVSLGDWVSEGDLLLSCTEISCDGLDLLEERAGLVDELEELHALLEQPNLTAPADGRVTGLTVSEGAAVEEGTEICTLTSTDDFTVSVQIPASSLPQVRVGQQAECIFDGVTYSGTVTHTSGRTQELGGLTVCTVTLRLTAAEGLAVGDEGEGSIILGREEEALLIPIEAVQVERLDTYLVRVSYGDGLTQQVEVEIGLQDGEMVQILDGLHEGDEVVVASRVVETTVFSFFNFEWIINQEEGQSEEGVLSETEDVTVVEDGTAPETEDGPAAD